MKISTITCHDVYNYGASLQAYALQEYCMSLGCQYQIIDYKPDYLSNHYNLTAICNSRCDHPVIRELYILAKLPKRLLSLKRKKTFDQFTRQYLNLSALRYHSNSELKENTPDSDIFIAGSDQIWNTTFNNGTDPAFYLDFASGKGRLISYAASFATDEIVEGKESFVREKIKELDAVSIRESSGVELAKKLGRNDALLVADPVFLLQKQEWSKLISNFDKPKKDYILIYDCERSVKLQEIATELKQRLHIPIFSLSPQKWRKADKSFHNAGPLEFLSLIANAKIVVANSFHALAFSIIFQKDFYIVNRSEKINTRMRDFLSYLGFEDRLISDSNQLKADSPNHAKAEPKLHTLINSSKQFINEQIELANV